MQYSSERKRSDEQDHDSDSESQGNGNRRRRYLAGAFRPDVILTGNGRRKPQLETAGAFCLCGCSSVVERDLAKVQVAGSNPVTHSSRSDVRRWPRGLATPFQGVPRGFESRTSLHGRNRTF